MIVDSSALIAIARREPACGSLLEKLERAEVVGIGTPTLAEAALVIRARLELDPQPLLDRFLRDFRVVTIAFGDRHWREAADAFARYGKGRHHAGLDFGDCMSYAVAKLAGAPLLFVGRDFSHTDIEAA